MFLTGKGDVRLFLEGNGSTAGRQPRPDANHAKDRQAAAAARQTSPAFFQVSTQHKRSSMPIPISPSFTSWRQPNRLPVFEVMCKENTYSVLSQYRPWLQIKILKKDKIQSSLSRYNSQLTIIKLENDWCTVADCVRLKQIEQPASSTQMLSGRIALLPSLHKQVNRHPKDPLLYFAVRWSHQQSPRNWLTSDIGWSEINQFSRSQLQQ
jgi:hypothetical protein